MRVLAVRVIAVALFATIVLVAGGCAVKRDIGPGRPLDQCDYAVLSPQTSGEYYQRASAMLDEPFVVVTDTDPRLELPRVRTKACTVAIDWAPGFWSSSGWVEIKDYAYGTHMHTSHMRRGMLWMGANEDVMEALRDVVNARAAAGPLPPDARNPMPAVASDSGGGRTTAERLEELGDLRTRGLISDAEYSAQRKAILREQ
jgi:hypothetical protein